MRIAQVMAGAPQGGAELFFERMTLALARAGNDVLPVVRAEPARVARLRDAGLVPVEFRFGGPFDFSTRPGIRRALSGGNVDVAIAWMSRAAGNLPRGNWKNIGRLGGYYHLKYFRTCEYLVGNTLGIVDYISGTGFPRDKIAHLPNFVDDFAGVEPLDRATLGVPEDAKLMLGLGRLHEVKGFKFLIQAAAMLPEVYCVIAGEGPERDNLTKLIAELGVGERVKLLGWREDSGALLKTADLFVSSSRHEPLGNMVLEAFSAQTPVLAARAEGPREVIRHGEDGILVPVNDARALADAAADILRDVPLQVKLSLHGRQRFMDEFSETTVVAAWMEFLTKVVR